MWERRRWLDGERDGVMEDDRCSDREVSAAIGIG